MQIISTKRTWAIKANDKQKRFSKGGAGVNLECDADLLQYAIWLASKAIQDDKASARLNEIWKALINHENTIL